MHACVGKNLRHGTFVADISPRRGGVQARKVSNIVSPELVTWNAARRKEAGPRSKKFEPESPTKSAGGKVEG